MSTFYPVALGELLINVWPPVGVLKRLIVHIGRIAAREAPAGIRAFLFRQAAFG
jgi:hypothetical protein